MDPLVCIITGAGSGIGSATARDLASIGCPVHLVGRRMEPLAAVAQAIRAGGGIAEAHPCDVRDAEALQSIASAVVERHGRIDVLVASAGVHDAADLRDGDPGRWREVIDTNVLGVANACHAVLPQMDRQRSGHLVLIASVAGRKTWEGEPVYTASKHAVVALADSLRQAVTRNGIRVTMLAPGMSDTPILDTPFGNELKKTVRVLDPSDCARAIRFALDQPPHCSVSEIVLRPTDQVF